LALCFWVQTVESWGVEGHKIVAQLAWDMLSDDCQGIATQFLGNRSLENISTIADSYGYSKNGGWSLPMHYCNLPVGAPNFTMEYCPLLCVVKAIQNYTARFQNDVKNPFVCPFAYTSEPCAMEFLVHFIGDIHQPLHCGYEKDLGGNLEKVYFFVNFTNLHSVWDSFIINRWAENWTIAYENLTKMIQEEPNIIKEYLSVMNPIDWANESYTFVTTDVYHFNMTEINNLKPKQDRNVINSVNIDDQAVPELGEWYYEQNLPIVKQRLIAAGVRLGSLMNSICDGLQFDH